MLHVEALESRYCLSRYHLIDLGNFHAYALNDWGEAAGLDSAGRPATWYRGDVTELPIPDGFRGATPMALNDWGQAAGEGILQDFSAAHALLWDSRGAIDLGGPFGRINSINNQGQLAGHLYAGPQATAWTPYRPADTFDGPGSDAWAINDAGQIAGQDSDKHAFRREADGSVAELPDPAAGDTQSSAAYSINREGDVVGNFAHVSPITDYPEEAAVWYADGRVVPLGIPPGYYQSVADGINSHGVVIGALQPPSGQDPVFVWDARHGMRDLNGLLDAPGWTILQARHINDAGQILADARSPSGATGQVILTPVPRRGARDFTWLGWALSLQDRH